MNVHNFLISNGLTFYKGRYYYSERFIDGFFDGEGPTQSIDLDGFELTIHVEGNGVASFTFDTRYPPEHGGIMSWISASTIVTFDDLAGIHEGSKTMILMENLIHRLSLSK